MSKFDDAKKKAQEVVVNAALKAIAAAPDQFIAGGKPDPLIRKDDGLVGADVSRLDGPIKVKGEARFAAEVALEGLLYGAIVYSTIACGRIRSLDISEAAASPGVALVMTYRNAPRLKPIPSMNLESPKGASNDDVPVMQDDRIYWNGQPIAVILAETQEQADYAKSLVHAEYERAPALTSFKEACAGETEVAEMIGFPLRTIINNAEKMFDEAPVKIESTYTTPRQNHNAIELHAVTVVWNGDELVVHDATQKLTHTAWSLAHAFSLDEKKVRVLSPFVGGGFGGKALWQHHVLAAAAARMAKRPVRMTLSREGVYRTVGGRAATQQRVAIGAQPDGTFDAIIHTGIAGITKHNHMPEPFIMGTRSLYAARSFKLDQEIVRMDLISNTWMRAPGEAVGTFALECAIDELSERLGMDPIELRLRNEPKKDPTNGLPFSSRNVEKIYRDGAERFGWKNRLAIPAQRREGEWLIGIGVAGGTYPYNRAPGGSAKLTLTAEGQAVVEVAAHEMGMGTATVHTQITAERLGLPMSQVSVKYGDSAMPGQFMAVGSQQTAAIGGAIFAAHRKLVEQLIKFAGRNSAIAGLSYDELYALNGGLAKIGDPKRYVSYKTIFARAGIPELTVEASGSLPLEALHWSMHSHSAMFCEAKVNAVTGEIRISRMLGSYDCGRILNAKTAASQLKGGIIMGIGMTLMEETQIDERKGRILNANLSDYHIPVHLDVPEIEVMWTDIADPRAPMGARGLGEIGNTGTSAAIANAIYNATGKRIRDLPITLDKLI